MRKKESKSVKYLCEEPCGCKEKLKRCRESSWETKEERSWLGAALLGGRGNGSRNGSREIRYGLQAEDGELAGVG